MFGSDPKSEPAHADRPHASCDAAPELFDPLPLDDRR
jgi:hypothetical protein